MSEYRSQTGRAIQSAAILAKYKRLLMEHKYAEASALRRNWEGHISFKKFDSAAEWVATRETS